MIYNEDWKERRAEDEHRIAEQGNQIVEEANRIAEEERRRAEEAIIRIGLLRKAYDEQLVVRREDIELTGP